MSRKLRNIHPNQLVEITCRTFQGRFLLAPSEELNRRLLGVLGRAQRRTRMTIHAFAVLSNHAHYLLSPRSGKQLARFMQYLQTNLSKEVQDLQDWDGPVWNGRYRCIPVSDEDDAHIARLRYILAHGVKEDLVAQVGDWPGLHCAPALLDDLEAAERRAAEGIRIRPLSAVDPQDRPESFTPTPAPFFHTATQAAWKALRDAYVDFVAQFREAATALRKGEKTPPFPAGSFPPGLPFVPHPVAD